MKNILFLLTVICLSSCSNNSKVVGEWFGEFNNNKDASGVYFIRQEGECDALSSYFAGNDDIYLDFSKNNKLKLTYSDKPEGQIGEYDINGDILSVKGLGNHIFKPLLNPNSQYLIKIDGDTLILIPIAAGKVANAEPNVLKLSYDDQFDLDARINSLEAKKEYELSFENLTKEQKDEINERFQTEEEELKKESEKKLKTFQYKFIRFDRK